MNDMHYSQSGKRLTETFEQCRLVAYRDSRGVWTIGYGHTKNVHPGMSCTQAQADAWLSEDIAWAEREVNRIVKVTLTQGEFDALVDFTFNCGAGNFEHSTLLDLLNHNDHAQAATEFAKWDKCGGVELPGLLRRRKAEAEEFMGRRNDN